MPKRTDISSILILGSGPIVIGQACEFDYSGTQACKAIREEGYKVILVNSNPATIMTDPETADVIYIEPITADVVAQILEKEKPDAVLPTLGGQTALNCAIELHERGVLEKLGIEMIGANVDAIRKAESREEFHEAMTKIGLDMPKSGIARTMEEAQKIKEDVKLPCVIRPAFTLGGAGGGFAYTEEEFEEIVTRGLDLSPVTEILVEESIVGWKEYEMEVMRDRKDNVVIICSIENLDAMGIHTGDSITVAPIQTLTDKEYQIMRDASIAVIREIGVETGGSNVQFAVNPRDGRMIVIEMNPRVSRSSALASKATGFPIAKIAAKLAVGYTLNEIQNDITRETPACFEPTIDYVVTKIPRFTFEKFPQTNPILGTQMKSVGEAMSIGRTFKESLQKALRSMETGRAGFGADGKEDLSAEELEKHLTVKAPGVDRIYSLRRAIEEGWSIEKLYEISGVDPWFLNHMRELVEFDQKELKGKALADVSAETLKQAKEWGYSDRQIAFLTNCDLRDVEKRRAEDQVIPVYKTVDTCAAEFAARTPYHYSSFDEENESVRTDRKKVIILGGGPNRIGQGIEFDYCCVHASFALQEEKYEAIMVNSNPETVSTDYDTSDKLYFEPLTREDVFAIVDQEKPDGIILQFGGQTPLKLAADLEEKGAKVIGTSPKSIDRAEDRELFAEMVEKLGLKQPPNGIAKNLDEALAAAEKVGYPILVRPSFVLGGRAMMIVYTEAELRRYLAEAVEASDEKPVLIDKFLDGATEVDVDCISDGETSVVAGIMEHIEPAGIHSGDSACVLPPHNLSDEIMAELKRQTKLLAKELDVIGLMNIQFAVKDNEVYLIEVNPRASRTVPFVSKAIGVPLAKLATKVMIGMTLKELGFTEEITPAHVSVKESVFPFAKFPGVDTVLSPEMKSTGEVMGIADNFGLAFARAQEAASAPLPREGSVFVSLNESDRDFLLPSIKDLAEMDFRIYATRGTANFLLDNGISSTLVHKISEGSPNAVDLLGERSIDLLINTPVGQDAQVDDTVIRRAALTNHISYTTTAAAAKAAVEAIRSQREEGAKVKSIHEYHGLV